MNNDGSQELSSNLSSSVFITDWEGPFGKNDYALELSAQYLPNGDNFFTLLSKYDDILADVLRRKNYGAGDTLKLILPFLKVYGANNNAIIKYSAENAQLLTNSIETLRFIQSIMPTFVISASYCICLEYISEHIGLPKNNIYCTDLNIDKYELNEKEATRLREIAEEIGVLIEQLIKSDKELGAFLEIPENASSIDDFAEKDRIIIEKLDRFFWEDIYNMEAGRMLQEVKVKDSLGKAKAIEEIIEDLKINPQVAMYVGDSITDALAFRFLKEKGGLTISFNGNEYALREAEIAIISEDTIVTSILAYIFKNCGIDGVRDITKEWSSEVVKEYCKDPILKSHIDDSYFSKLPKVELISQKNINQLIEESTNFRKTIRGKKIGALG